MRRSVRLGRTAPGRSRGRLEGAPILANPLTLHRIHGLAGGAKLVSAAMPERLSASLVFMFGGGSRLEDERHAGVSHFIEHLFFKGTERRPTSKEIADAIEGVGGVGHTPPPQEITPHWT